MKKLILITTIAIASMAATPAASDAAATNAKQAAAAQATDNAGTDKAQAAPEEKKLCRLLQSSYSHRMDRVCLTKDGWAKIDSGQDQ
jgi:Ni/Co efflux regulator RcnB